MRATWLSLCLICSILLMSTHVHGDTRVPIAFLDSAISKGAVCLDGSAPAYSYAEGSGSGSHSWIVFLQGGGWCYNVSDCYNRSLTDLGSSKKIDSSVTTFSALLDSNCTYNPDFCNWHKAYIYYCDGSSFMSDIMDTKANLSFRGARIFNVMMEEMISKGMGNAKHAMLTGTSAGGLAAMLHCDKFRGLIPGATQVKCISDSGFFLHGEGQFNAKSREIFFDEVIKTHNLANFLPPTCTSKRNQSLCIFPEYFAGDIQTPLFITESAFDKYQLTELLLGNQSCTRNVMTCNSTELEIIRDFRTTFIKTLEGLKDSWSRGMFVHSCYLHGHLPNTRRWTDIILADKSLAEAVADWYYDRSPFREIDTKNESPQVCILHHKQQSLAAPPHKRLSFLLFFSFFIFICKCEDLFILYLECLRNNGNTF